MKVTGVAVLLPVVASAALLCAGAETDEETSCEQRAAFEEKPSYQALYQLINRDGNDIARSAKLCRTRPRYRHF